MSFTLPASRAPRVVGRSVAPSRLSHRSSSAGAGAGPHKADRSKQSASFIIWAGRSPVNGSSLVAVLTTRRSTNPKTGDMLGLWVFPAAVKDGLRPGPMLTQGKDSACCGDCAFRSKAAGGSGGCYTHAQQLFLGASSLLDALANADWPRLDLLGVDQGFIRTNCAPSEANPTGRRVRLGVYGDPGLLPFPIVEAVCQEAGFDRLGRPQWVGYTHAWRSLDARWAPYLMASVKNTAAASEAQRRGWRTFRVGLPDQLATPGREFHCPASEEMGSVSSCNRCLGCAGTSSLQKRGVFIQVHGSNGVLGHTKNVVSASQSGLEVGR